MENNRIKSVQKGYGEGDIFYSTDKKVVKQYLVDEIKVEPKQVGKGEYGLIVYDVLKGYINNEIIFEMGMNIDVTIVYWPKEY